MSRIVIATRMPKPIDHNAPHIFDVDGDVVADCAECGYHVMGPRRDVGLALKDHQRMFHSPASAPLVTLINNPIQ